MSLINNFIFLSFRPSTSHPVPVSLSLYLLLPFSHFYLHLNFRIPSCVASSGLFLSIKTITLYRLVIVVFLQLIFCLSNGNKYDIINHKGAKRNQYVYIYTNKIQYTKKQQQQQVVHKYNNIDLYEAFFIDLFIV